jgi:hypothetical protein
MPAKKPGIGSRDYFSSPGTIHGNAPSRRVDQLAVDADVARAARAAGHKSLLARLRSRLSGRRDEVRGTEDTV